MFYAATSWKFYFSQIEAASEENLDLLVQLFQSSSVLAWIHLLALASRLEILAETAKVLTQFVRTRRKLNAVENPMLHRHLDLEFLDWWALDFVKVVGKFSKHLISVPSAIYKLVPPVSPRESALYRQFHQPETAEVLVSGIPNTAWNDTSARLVLPDGEQAWEIACASNYVAILGNTGTTYLWQADNFIPIGNLRHNEPVMALAINNKGDKLVTFGLRTVKLWSLPSKRLLSTVLRPSDSKVMAIVFTEDDQKIYVASGNREIRYLLTQDFGAGWHGLDGTFLKETFQINGAAIGSPMCMAFNEDATQVGISYQGSPLSVWSLNEPRCISRCWRATHTDSIHAPSQSNWCAVKNFIWNPVSGHVIGLYRDGCIFKWHPITAENVEFQSTAIDLAASSNGKLFLTSDSDGIVRLWDFAHFSIIYQISSTSVVVGLAFSPDCRRFYDLRGCCVSAWEPNSLIRFSETEETNGEGASENGSLSTTTKVSVAELLQYEAISALDVAPNGTLFCTGNEEGIVKLVDTATGEITEVTKFPNLLRVSHLAWGADERHLVAADLIGDVIAERVTLTQEKGQKKSVEIKPICELIVDGVGSGIHQLLLSHDSKLLLIITEDRGHIWAVEDHNMRASLILEHDMSRRWLQHPISDDLFFGFGASDLRVFQWSDFAERPRFYFQEERRLSFSQNSEANVSHVITSSVTKAMLAQDGKHILVQVKDVYLGGRATKRLLIFATSALNVIDEDIHTLTYKYIPPNIAAMIDIPLGILPGLRLTFLDEDLWMCTSNLDWFSAIQNEEAVQRHYFIPRDWASGECLEKSHILKDGTFLCAVADQVAIVRSTLGVAGF